MPQCAGGDLIRRALSVSSVEIGDISYPDEGAGDYDFMVDGIRVTADGPAYGELANVVRTDEGYDFTSRSDYRLRLDYSGEGDLFAIIRPVGRADGTISYSVGTQGGEFYSFGLSEKGASISALGLTITQELRPEVAAVRFLADVGRNPMVQAGLQTFGYFSSKLAEAVAPQQYADMERNVAQVAGIWTGYVDRMVSEGRMTPQTGADFAVAVPTTVAFGAAALGARGSLRDAGVGARMLGRSLPSVEMRFASAAELNATTFSTIGAPGLRVRLNLNANSATSNFGVYEISVAGSLYKVGKADLLRVTQSSGLPTRLHQQLRMFERQYGKDAVVGRIVEDLGPTTTAQARLAELARLQRILNETGVVPEGNRRSFKP